jgi:hypothetical protein
MFFVAAGGMNDEPRRLIDDQQHVILVQDLERDVLWLGGSRAGLRPADFDLFPGARGMRGFDGSTIHEDAAFLDQTLKRAS